MSKVTIAIVLLCTFFAGILPAAASPADDENTFWVERYYLHREPGTKGARLLLRINQLGLIEAYVSQEEIDNNQGPNNGMFGWGLMQNNPELINELMPKVGPDGGNRSGLVRMLRDTGVSISDFDAAVESEHTTLFDGGWGYLTQTAVEDKIVYISFWKQEGDIPADAAVVDNPYYRKPSVGYVFVDSPTALQFRDSKEFAKCSQQALLDAGFDPQGVDGAPGRGAQAALTAWAEANGVTAPIWDRTNSSQVCYLLTSVLWRHAGLQSASRIVYPGMASAMWGSKSGGLHDFEGINQGMLMDGEDIAQISWLDFGPGITFFADGDPNTKVREPFPLSGTVILHGTDSDRASTLFKLLEQDPTKLRKNIIESQGGGWQSDTLINRLRNGTETILYTVIGEVDGSEVVLAEAFSPKWQDNIREVIVFTDDGQGGGQLLYTWFQAGWTSGIVPTEFVVGKIK